MTRACSAGGHGAGGQAEPALEQPGRDAAAGRGALAEGRLQVQRLPDRPALDARGRPAPAAPPPGRRRSAAGSNSATLSQREERPQAGSGMKATPGRSASPAT